MKCGMYEYFVLNQLSTYSTNYQPEIRMVILYEYINGKQFVIYRFGVLCSSAAAGVIHYPLQLINLLLYHV